MNNAAFKKYVILGLVSLVVLLTTLALFVRGQKESQTAQRKQNQISSLIRVTIGQTTTSQIDALPNIQKKERLPGGGIKYSLSGNNPIRPDEIRAENNVAVFERIAIPEKKADLGYATISEYKTKYGQPDAVLPGSKAFGFYMVTYVYSTKGFALIANPNTDEIFEIQHFIPMPTEDYLKRYGEDVTPKATPIREQFPAEVSR